MTSLTGAAHVPDMKKVDRGATPRVQAARQRAACGVPWPGDCKQERAEPKFSLFLFSVWKLAENMEHCELDTARGASPGQAGNVERLPDLATNLGIFRVLGSEKNLFKPFLAARELQRGKERERERNHACAGASQKAEPAKPQMQLSPTSTLLG